MLDESGQDLGPGMKIVLDGTVNVKIMALKRDEAVMNEMELERVQDVTVECMKLEWIRR